MHRGQGDRVGQLGWDGDFTYGWIPIGHDVDVCREVLGSISHHVEIPLHVRLLDASEVIADAHVEHHARIAREPEFVVECMDEHPRAEILVEGLVDPELL